jgi:lipid-A-disaccharide synthase
MAKTFFIVAGEASGDLHASHLVRELKNIYPDAFFRGLGGEKMRDEGVELFCDLTALAVVGFVEVLKNYKTFKKIFDAFLQKIKIDKPDALILVDYPGFNLRLAKEAKALGTKVVYFISPQVWAWGRERIAFIKKNIDLMLVLFKFEEALYKDGAFRVSFVGHPLLDAVKTTRTREQMLEEAGLKKSSPTIALLPGSREREIRSLLPVLLEAAQKIWSQKKDSQFIICRSASVGRQTYKDLIEAEKIDFPYKMVDQDTYNSVQASDLALVASGTATLECAILDKPMIIIYKVSLLTWILAKCWLKIP